MISCSHMHVIVSTKQVSVLQHFCSFTFTALPSQSIRVVPDFGSGKSEIRLFFTNPAKSGYGQISSRIWQTLVQPQCIQIITDKK